MLGLVAACTGDGTATTEGDTDATSSESSASDPSTTSPTTSMSTSETTTDDPATTSPTTTASTTDDTSSSGTTTSDASTSSSSETTGTTDASSSSSSSESSGTGETESDSDTDTGGNQIGECAEACEPGCTDTLLWSHTGEVTTHHSGSRIATLDDAGRLALWNADDAARIMTATGVGWVALGGDTLVYDTGAMLQVVSATDGSALGSIGDGAARGVATDGDYVWTATGNALSVYEPDGTLRFAIADDYVGAMVLALPDALHVFAPNVANDEVVRIDAVSQAQSTIAFDGAFDGWFADAPRFWTRSGQAYYAYDTDGTELAFEIGAPIHGWATRLVLIDQFGSAEVVDVSDPETVIADFLWSYRISGPAVLSVSFDEAPMLTRLDADPITSDAVAPVCCVTEFDPWSFAFADDRWAIGGEDGSAADEQGRRLGSGQIDFSAGSVAGRVAAADAFDLTHVWDVAPDCTITEYPAFARPSSRFWIAGGGSMLAGAERWIGPSMFLQAGMRVYSLPDGVILGASSQGLQSDQNVAGAISDDAGLFARTWRNMDLSFYSVYSFPALEAIHGDFSDIVPALAPDSAHVVLSDGISGPADSYDGAQSYVYDPTDLVATFPGITRAFLDVDRLLVEHYTNDGQCGWPVWECDVHVGSEIVDLDGVVIQEADLPIIREIERISPTELLAIDHATIFDAYTGEALWQAPDGFTARVAGEDHVLVSDGAVVQVLRWR